MSSMPEILSFISCISLVTLASEVHVQVPKFFISECASVWLFFFFFPISFPRRTFALPCSIAPIPTHALLRRPSTSVSPHTLPQLVFRGLRRSISFSLKTFQLAYECWLVGRVSLLHVGWYPLSYNWYSLTIVIQINEGWLLGKCCTFDYNCMVLKYKWKS